MPKSAIYFFIVLFSCALFFSCGKETSESLISFNQEDVENNGNRFNVGCLDCDLFTWCDNAQYTYSPIYRGTAGGQIIHKYKNIGIRRVGSFDFTITVARAGDTIFHHCQNNITRILGEDRSLVLTIVKGDGALNESWTDVYSGGDTTIKYKITGIDLPITIGSKTYVSTIRINEEKYFNSGTNQTLITKTENIYAKDRINAARISGIGLIKQTITNPVGVNLYQRTMTAYTLP